MALGIGILFGTGIAVVSGGNLIATSLAFGLAIVSMAYVIGNISGCHVNPAVSLAMFMQKKLTAKEFGFYVLAQVLGAFAGSGVLYWIICNTTLQNTGLGANGYGELSAVGLSLLGALLVEIIADRKSVV